MRLDLFDNTNIFTRGRPAWVEMVWLMVQAFFVNSWIPGSLHRIFFLRLFGAKIGKGVVIKPGVRVKFPWRLTVGNYSWIGEDVWIDNLAQVNIGSHCCISQDVYICTGNHDREDERFSLITSPVTVKDKVWLCAKSVAGPGIVVNEGAILGLCSVAVNDLHPWSVYQGIPAKLSGKRNNQA